MQTIEETILQQIKDNPILLYMKGTPEIPQCGFSARAVAAIRASGVNEFAFVNILEHPDIRATLPKLMNWPTFPQLYINGELIGGCDIVCEMQASGELAPLLQNANQ